MHLRHGAQAPPFYQAELCGGHPHTELAVAVERGITAHARLGMRLGVRLNDAGELVKAFTVPAAVCSHWGMTGR